MPKQTKKIAVLISGSGSNLQAIIDKLHNQKITDEQFEIVAVISNKAEAFGLERAKKAKINTVFVDDKACKSRVDYDHKLINEIDKLDVDVIILAGFMRILSSNFVNKYTGKILNIHPSLLPKYTGLNTHQRAIDANDHEHGASVHFVTAELDGGPVILQAKVPVFDDDNADDLAERVLTQEHQIYPLVIQWFLTDRLVMNNEQAVLDHLVLAKNGYAVD